MQYIAKPLKVEGTGTPEEIARAYVSSQERHDRERLLAIQTAQQGNHTLEEISWILKRGHRTIVRWIKAYRDGGIEKLLRRSHGGRKASLSKPAQEALISEYSPQYL